MEHDMVEAKDPRFTGMLDLMRTGGLVQFELRYSDPSEDGDEGPVVWMAIGDIKTRDGTEGSKVAAGFHPVEAVIALTEALLDGGKCVHCERPTAFDPTLDRSQVFNPEVVCWRAWNSDAETFERGCA